MTDDPPPLHGYPAQQPAQNPHGETAPHGHDRREPVVIPRKLVELKAQLRRVRANLRFPANDPVYQMLKASLDEMEEEQADTDDTDDDIPVPDELNVANRRIDELTAECDQLKLDQRALRAVFSGQATAWLRAIDEVADLKSQRDELLLACEASKVRWEHDNLYVNDECFVAEVRAMGWVPGGSIGPALWINSLIDNAMARCRLVAPAGGQEGGE